MKKEELYLNHLRSIKSRVESKLESLGLSEDAIRFFCDEVTFKNLETELTETIVNKDRYVSNVRGYLKDAVKQPNLQNMCNGYHVVDNQCWLTDSHSCFKIITNDNLTKLQKAKYKESESNIENIIKEFINTDIDIDETKNNLIKIDTFNNKLPKCIDGKVTLVKLFGESQSPVHANEKYLKHASKLLNEPTLRIYRINSRHISNLLILDKANKPIGVILPVNINKELRYDQ